MHRWEVCAAIAAQRVVAIVRAEDQQAARRAVEVLVEAQLRVVEVSLTTPGALDVIAEIAGLRVDGLVLGAGTVLDDATARLAVLAGAQFLVAPTLSADVLATAHRYGAAAIPGVATAAEAVRALELGDDLVKLFPASAYGPAAVRDLLQALPQVPLVPTGGVSLDDAADYLAAGAVAVGMGSSLTRGEPDSARRRVADLLAKLGAAETPR